jgi:hypothetical protein
MASDGLIPHLHRLGSRQFANIIPATQVRRRQTDEDEIPF